MHLCIGIYHITACTEIQIKRIYLFKYLQSTSYYASNLKPDCFYQFRVRAGNKLGLSRPSEISDIVQPLDFWLSPSEYESDG